MAFVGRLPQLSPQQYSEIILRRTPVAEPLKRDTSSTADMARGKRALYQYACNACHTIPGVTGSAPNVGPPLAVLVSHYRMPADAAFGLFATARSVGLVAHSLEQLGVPQVIRPRGRYVGPMPVAVQV